MNKIKNRGVAIALMVAFIILFACSIVGAFLYMPTASAMSSVTTFTTTTYLDQMMAYKANLIEYNSLYSTWYFTFDVEANGMGFYLYTIDHNYNSVPTEIELMGRPYNDGNYNTPYYMTKYGTGERYIDYLLQYENDEVITDIAPQYLTISYTSMKLSPYDWTAKRFTEATGWVIANYTWGNHQYRFTYSFIVRTTDELANTLDAGGAPISDTMYFSSDMLETNQYQNGFEAGYLQGIKYGTTIVDKDSASYIQGVADGVEQGHEFTFFYLFSGIADSTLQIFDGLLGFDFLGFNMLTFFKFLITLGMAFAIFRLIRGG